MTSSGSARTPETIELLLAGAIVMAGSAWVASVVIAFGGIAAAAGVRALYLGKEILCNCFGERRGRNDMLGLRQLIQFPYWLMVAWSVVQITNSVGSSGSERLVMLAISAVATAIAVLWQLQGAVRPMALERIQRVRDQAIQGEP